MAANHSNRLIFFNCHNCLNHRLEKGNCLHKLGCHNMNPLAIISFCCVPEEKEMFRKTPTICLVFLLLYRIVPGTFMSGDAISKPELTTSQGEADAVEEPTSTRELAQHYEHTACTIETSSETLSSNEERPHWQTAIERFQTVMALFGYIANMVTLISLARNGDSFSSSTCLLLKHQSLVDSGVCVVAAATILQPSLWTTGVFWVDAIVCLFWHSQAIYWFTVFVSTWNLVLISVERYLAVCMPFSHSSMTPKRMWLTICLLYPFSLVGSLPCFVQYNFDFKKHECLTESAIPGQLGYDVFYAYSIIGLFIYYLLPILAYIVMYSRIVYTLQMRKKNTELAESRIIEVASDSMTKAAIALTLIFFFSLGFDSWYYTLGYTGVVFYDMESPIQQTGVFLAVFNSCVNPCVYAVLMPAYRKSLKKTFCCGKDGKQETSNVSTELTDRHVGTSSASISTATTEI